MSRFIVNKVGTQYFQGNDSKSLYDKNLLEQPEDWEYRTKQVEYNKNSLGFRTPYEFANIDWNNTIAIFGDSHAYGTGLSEEDTIAVRLEQLTGYKCINLGVPASSNQVTLSNMLALSKLGDPKIVINFWTEPARFVVCDDNDFYHCGYWSHHATHKFKGLVEQRYKLLSDDHFKFESDQFYQLHRKIWSNSQIIDITFYDLFDYLAIPLIPHEDYARDLLHPGSKTIAKLAVRINNGIDTSTD